MKVLFIIPETKSMFGTEKAKPIHPHVGIAYLISVLKKNNHHSIVIDCGIEKKPKLEIKNKIKEFNPDVIGITSFSYAYGYLQQITKYIKTISKIPIIIGGPHISAVKNKILKDIKTDFAMYGESEISFLEFLNEFTKNKPNYNKVHNLIWGKNNKIVTNPQTPPIKNLDILPIPSYEDFKLTEYPCFSEKIIPIITSRGCPYGCNYCSVRLSMGQNFRPRSPKNVFTEIKYWHKKGFTNFDFNDDCFTLDTTRAEKICDLIIKSKLKIKFQLYNGIRVNNITLKLLNKLKKAGCFFIAYGCESGNQKILNKIKKNITLEQVKNAVSLTKKSGIRQAVNFIIGHQGETYQDALDTLKFAEELDCNYVNFYNLVPYPGTEVYNWATKKAKFLISKNQYLKKISYRDNKPIFETKKFTKEQRVTIMKKGFFLYEKKLFQFRFGKTIGTLFFLITRIQFISNISRKMVYNNKIIAKIFSIMTSKSKQLL